MDERAGRVRAIYIAEQESGPVRPVAAVAAVAGAGLVGDRGADAPRPPDEQLTLVAFEAIEAANREHGLSLGEGDTRRNLVTEGLDLNALVGQEFAVGEVRARGIERCEPCVHLQRLTGQSVIKALAHRGGLRAEILTDGTVRRGDVVRPFG